MATQFQTGNDFSLDGVTRRRLKADTFDTYEFIGYNDVTISHFTRRRPAEYDKKTGYMIAGEAYDVYALRQRTEDTNFDASSITHTLGEYSTMVEAINAGKKVILNLITAH